MEMGHATVTFLNMADIVKSMSSVARGKCPQFLSATSEFLQKTECSFIWT